MGNVEIFSVKPPYGCMRGPIWVHARADMGALEGQYGFTQAGCYVFGIREVSAKLTKHIVTIFSKPCDKKNNNLRRMINII